MTNEEFGSMVLPWCHVARVRSAILASAKRDGYLCAAEWGFISAIQDRITPSEADKRFLAAINKWVCQLRITEVTQ